MISAALDSLFDSHVSALAEARKRRREDLALRGALEIYQATDAACPVQTTPVEDEDPAYGLALPDDLFEGDAHLRTLNRLLAEIDKRGFERSGSPWPLPNHCLFTPLARVRRSSQQVEFHDAFIMACGRVLYKADWSLSRPDICERNQWSKTFGGEARRFPPTVGSGVVPHLTHDANLAQVMVSTPRRFGCAAISFLPKAASPSLTVSPTRPQQNLRGRHVRRGPVARDGPRDCHLQ